MLKKIFFTEKGIHIHILTYAQLHFEMCTLSLKGCTRARGLAISSTLSLLVCSTPGEVTTLHAFRLPDMIGAELDAEFTIIHPVPLHDWQSGYMVFTDDDYLLIANSTHYAVLVFDVHARKYIGDVFAPSEKLLPHDVASHGNLIAVSGRFARFGVWEDFIAMYQRCEPVGDLPQWKLLHYVKHSVDHHLLGLAFSASGDTIAVAAKHEVLLFDVGSGLKVKSSLTFEGYGFADVEECEDGWVLLAGEEHLNQACLILLNENGFVPFVKRQFCPVIINCIAIARSKHMIFHSMYTDKLSVYLTPAGVAMASMTKLRVAWMMAVVHAVTRANLHANVL